MENTSGETQENMEPQIVKEDMEVSVATSENLDKPSGESTLGPHHTASLELSEWKLVTKKFSGEAIVP